MYIVHVQLRIVEDEKPDYRALHEQMEKHGFKRTITDVNGVEFYLPHAEYYFESEDTTEEVADNVKVIADAVDVGAIVLVSQIVEVAGLGLKKVVPKRRLVLKIKQGK